MSQTELTTPPFEAAGSAATVLEVLAAVSDISLLHMVESEREAEKTPGRNEANVTQVVHRSQHEFVWKENHGKPSSLQVYDLWVHNVSVFTN